MIGRRSAVLTVMTLTAAALVGAGGAVASALDDAKDAGLIGERPDGYVAAVEENPPASIAALVQGINEKRRRAYAKIAVSENVPVAQVAALAAEKIRAQAPPGHYFMTADGRWTPK